MKNQITRLENALQMWEDRCWFYRKVNYFTQKTGQIPIRPQCPRVGPVAHSDSLRKHLLQACNPNATFELERYCGVGELREFLIPQLLPYYLWQWTQCSRRIYHISAELQLFLRATALDGVTWGEVKMPFDSFAIQLNDPIKDPKSGQLYDVLFISKHEIQRSSLDLVLLNKKLEDYTAVTSTKRQSIEQDFRDRQWDKIGHWLKALNARHNECLATEININLDRMQGAAIEDYPEADAEKDKVDHPHADVASLWEQTVRTLVGLCLYLRTLPVGSSHQSEWKPVHKTVGLLDAKCITREALICAVSSIHTITREERQILAQAVSGQGGYELRAHFRCGHWRRPPGLGLDPSAEKTVWVRPSWVRRDRLPKDGVPGGSEFILS